MPVTDPYLDAAGYKARVNKTSAADDPAITAQLTAISRYIDQRCRRFFTKDAAAVTRVFDGNGLQRIWLPADVASTTGLTVTIDLDGDYVPETALVLNTDYWVGPYNADKGPEPRPFEFLEVSPLSTHLSVWPDWQRAVQVAAVWGWPAVPAAIAELTVALARQLRDGIESGIALAVQDIDSAIRTDDRVTILWSRIEREYARPQDQL